MLCCWRSSYLKGQGCDPFDMRKSAIVLYIPQTRCWISIGICHCLFYVLWFEVSGSFSYFINYFCGLVDHHCFNYLFTISFLSLKIQLFFLFCRHKCETFYLCTFVQLMNNILQPYLYYIVILILQLIFSSFCLLFHCIQRVPGIKEWFSLYCFTHSDVQRDYHSILRSCC